jgi:hypothetical protein
MDTAIVVAVFEFFQFPLQAMRIPEKNASLAEPVGEFFWFWQPS